MPGGVIIPDKKKPKDNRGYFEVITKSVFQAGFSFEVIERKWEGFREVFSNFDPSKISKWSEADVIEALESPLIVRNQKKIKATIENAKTFQEIVKQNGSFANYIDSIREMDYEERSKEISSKFKWMGKTGTFVFFYSINEDVPEWEDR
ncbi:MAG: DNA-3-methyladenine glycosylase I [Candidatus Kariarchaeaceae archaeon]|jgi:3-methyladenine DNA glycosylase Tag